MVIKKNETLKGEKNLKIALLISYSVCLKKIVAVFFLKKFIWWLKETKSRKELLPAKNIREKKYRCSSHLSKQLSVSKTTLL